MDFVPNSQIVLCRQVPLDTTYKDTLTFSNATDQYNFMLSKSFYRLDGSTYQRPKEGRLRVNVVADQLFDANYMMFQNTAYGSKWFYAFVTDVQYVSPNSSDVLFEIDILQSWMFQYQIKQCFVEREHVNDDTVGLHTIPEGLELGGYITTDEASFKLGELAICLLATEDLPLGTMNPPAVVGGFPIPTYWKILGDISDFTLSSLQAHLDAFAIEGKADAVVGVFTVPTNWYTYGSNVRVQTFNCASKTLTITPKNNKLQTYPYVSLAVSALGQGLELRYELFGGVPRLKVRGGFGANMQVSASPVDYEGQLESIQNTVSVKDFPLMPWVTNYFQNWLAQNKANIAISTVSSVISLGIGVGATIATGGIAAGAIGGGLSGIANTLGQVYQHSILPDKMSGSATAGDIFAVSGLTGFYTYCRAIRAEYASIIDDYFSMFGYKVNTVKIPNVNGRSSWNYVKTIDSVVVGLAPSPVLAKVREILNRGVTFWHGDYVGDYTRDNSIV